jgi:flagellar hook-length control protein FliK
MRIDHSTIFSLASGETASATSGENANTALPGAFLAELDQVCKEMRETGNVTKSDDKSEKQSGAGQENLLSLLLRADLICAQLPDNAPGIASADSKQTQEGTEEAFNTKLQSVVPMTPERRGGVPADSAETGVAPYKEAGTPVISAVACLTNAKTVVTKQPDTETAFDTCFIEPGVRVMPELGSSMPAISPETGAMRSKGIDIQEKSAVASTADAKPVVSKQPGAEKPVDADPTKPDVRVVPADSAETGVVWPRGIDNQRKSAVAPTTETKPVTAKQPLIEKPVDTDTIKPGVRLMSELSGVMPADSAETGVARSRGIDIKEKSAVAPATDTKPAKAKQPLIEKPVDTGSIKPGVRPMSELSGVKPANSAEIGVVRSKGVDIQGTAATPPTSDTERAMTTQPDTEKPIDTDAIKPGVRAMPEAGSVRLADSAETGVVRSKGSDIQETSAVPPSTDTEPVVTERPDAVDTGEQFGSSIPATEPLAAGPAGEMSGIKAAIYPVPATSTAETAITTEMEAVCAAPEKATVVGPGTASGPFAEMPDNDPQAPFAAEKKTSSQAPSADAGITSRIPREVLEHQSVPAFGSEELKNGIEYKASQSPGMLDSQEPCLSAAGGPLAETSSPGEETAASKIQALPSDSTVLDTGELPKSPPLFPATEPKESVPTLSSARKSPDAESATSTRLSADPCLDEVLAEPAPQPAVGNPGQAPPPAAEKWIQDVAPSLPAATNPAEAVRRESQETKDSAGVASSIDSVDKKASPSSIGLSKGADLDSAPNRIFKEVVTESRREGISQPPSSPVPTSDKREPLAQASTQASTPRGQEFAFQLAEKMQLMVRNGNGEIHIQLRPENLGRLDIKAEAGVQGVIAKISTESSSVKSYLESNLHVLQQSFQEQGLKVERIDVLINEGFDARNASAQHQNSGENGPSHDQVGSSPVSSARLQRDAVQDETLADSPMLVYLSPNSTFHTTA